MTVISGIAGTAPFQTGAPPQPQPPNPPAREAAPPVTAAERAGNERPTDIKSQPDTKPVEAAKPASDSADAKRSDAAAQTDKTRGLKTDDVRSLSVFDRPAVPLPVEEYLPAPPPEGELSQAEQSARAAATANAEKSERLRDGVAASATQPPKGEALNMLIPMPDGTEVAA